MRAATADIPVGTAVDGRSHPETPDEAAARPSSVARPHGWRPTLRHQAIVVAYFALLFAGLAPLLESWGRWAAFNATVAALLVSPWLLATLVLLFDRSGPLKHWLAPVLLATFGPMLALGYDLAAVAEWAARGTAPPMAPLVVVNLFFMAAFAYYIRHVGPTTCPTCARRALIPVYYLWGTSMRTRTTRWCAACGASYWRRSRDTPWQRERRSI